MKAAVLADPDDLLTLQVYADALLELGDPLGEVVRAAAHHPFPRVAHASEHFIAGKLASSLIDLTLERAVMTAVTLRRLTPRGFARITGRKEWHSVRSIHFERGKTAKTQVLPVNEVVGLLTHPVMSSLREVTGFDQAVLAELGTQPKRLPVEAVEVLGHDDHHFPQQPLPALAAVKRLSFTCCLASDFEELMTSSFINQIRVLDLEMTRNLGMCLLVDYLDHYGPQLEMVRDSQCQALREADGWHLAIRASGSCFLTVLDALERQAAPIRSVILETSRLVDDLRAEVHYVADANNWEFRLNECLRYGPVGRPGDRDAPF